MEQIGFSWDKRKDRENRRKHGVGFAEAQTVFHDENARLIADPAHSEEEERFILLGMSSSLRILLVCHCYWAGSHTIRVISARKASKREREQYEEYLP